MNDMFFYFNLVALAEPPADVVSYLFPWVEEELAGLEDRMARSRLNRDIALKKFLILLQWLRLVLVQDCALLYARYPDCPIFRFAPFTFSSFKTFSANAAALVAAAEEKARLAFHNLPDHMAQSMRGYATDLQMKQEQNHAKLSQELQELRTYLEPLLSASAGSKHRVPSEFCLIWVLSCHKLTWCIVQSCHRRRPFLHQHR
jgi:Centromere DNA-binding protein complex CBF3 subunit, domain 2